MEVVPPLVKDGKIVLFGSSGKETKHIESCLYYPASEQLTIRLQEDMESLILHNVKESTLERQGYSTYNIGLK